MGFDHTDMLYPCLNRKTVLVNPYCVMMILEALLLVPSCQKYLDTVFLIGSKITWKLLTISLALKRELHAALQHAHFTHQWVFMKLFKTNNIDVVKSCQSFFDFSLSSDLWTRRNKKLNVTCMTCDKIFVHYGN